MIQRLIQTHITIINTNSDFSTICDNIISGVFEHRVKYLSCGKLVVNIPDDVEIWITKWYRMAQNLSFKNIDFTFTVYRAIRNIPKSIIDRKHLPHPLPFSTTLSENFAKEWLGNDDGIVLCMQIHSSMLYTVITDDIEAEVVLSPGDIFLDTHDGYARYEPYKKIKSN